MTLIIQIIITLACVCAIALIVNKIEDSKKDYMSFREAIDLVGLPIVTFTIGDRKLHFILDTGANKSVINKKIADKLGIPTEDTSKVVGLEGKVQECSFITLDIQYKGTPYRERFQVLDMTAPFKEIKAMYGPTLHGILGSSFMEKYKYVLDFKEMIAYSKK